MIQETTTGQPLDPGTGLVEIVLPAGLPETVYAAVTWTLDHPDGCQYVIEAEGTLTLNEECIQYSGTISGTLTKYNADASQCSSTPFSQVCTIRYRWCHAAYGVALTGCRWLFRDWGMPNILGNDPIGTYTQGAVHTIGPEAVCDCTTPEDLDVTVEMEVS